MPEKYSENVLPVILLLRVRVVLPLGKTTGVVLYQGSRDNSAFINPATVMFGLKPGQGSPGAATGRVRQGRACTDLVGRR